MEISLATYLSAFTVHDQTIKVGCDPSGRPLLLLQLRAPHRRYSRLQKHPLSTSCRRVAGQVLLESIHADLLVGVDCGPEGYISLAGPI